MAEIDRMGRNGNKLLDFIKSFFGNEKKDVTLEWENQDGSIEMTSYPSIKKFQEETNLKNESGTITDLQGNEVTIGNSLKLEGSTKSEILIDLKNGVESVFRFKQLINTERSFPERWMIGITYDNELVFWGYKNGYFGNDGSSNDALGAYIMPTPKEEKNINIKELIATTWGLYLLYENGNLYFRGYNGYGQGGTGNNAHQYDFIKVLDKVEKVVSSSHGYHQDYITTLALRKFNDGTTQVWGTGRGGYGQLAKGNFSDSNTFQKCEFSADYDVNDEIIDIFVNDTNVVSTYALTKSGQLFASGYGGDGCLGLGDSDNRNIFTRITGDLVDKKVIQFVCGGGTRSGNSAYYRHSCIALVEDSENKRRVFSWGYGGNGELGLNNTNSYNTPQEIYALSDKNIQKIFGFRGSWTNYFAIDTGGTAWAWGYNNYGSLGINSSSNTISIPTKVDIDEPIKDVFLGAGSGTYSYHHATLFLTINNKIFVSGYDGQNQVGDIWGQANKPREINIPNRTKIIQISTGGYSDSWFWSVLYEDGKNYCWGDNDYQTSRLYDSTGSIAIPSLLGV